MCGDLAVIAVCQASSRSQQRGPYQALSMCLRGAKKQLYPIYASTGHVSVLLPSIERLPRPTRTMQNTRRNKQLLSYCTLQCSLLKWSFASVSLFNTHTSPDGLNQSALQNTSITSAWTRCSTQISVGQEIHAARRVAHLRFSRRTVSIFSPAKDLAKQPAHRQCIPIHGPKYHAEGLGSIHAQLGMLDRNS